jgi:hypothetical protein
VEPRVDRVSVLVASCCGLKPAGPRRATGLAFSRDTRGDPDDHLVDALNDAVPGLGVGGRDEHLCVLPRRELEREESRPWRAAASPHGDVARDRETSIRLAQEVDAGASADLR